MSLKYQCIDSGEGYYTLPPDEASGVAVPARIFLSEKLYAESEEGLYAQIRSATQYPGVIDVVVTPDAHIGSAVPVGCVIATDGALLQSPIGYDIGCGIMCFRSDVPHTKGLDEKLRRKFSEEVMKRIGLGVGQRGTVSVTHKAFQKIIREGASAVGYSRTHSEREFLPVDDGWDPPARAVNRGIDQLCSLGGGNHFAELQYDDQGKLCVMVHTGSRGFGFQLATHYMNLCRAEQQKRGAKAYREGTYFLPDSPQWNGYKNAIAAGGNFAIANRLYLWEQIGTAFRRVFGQEPELVYEISHNLAQHERLPDGREAWVHRKGATRAFPAGHPELVGTEWETTGHPVLIPGSMGDKSYILTPAAGVSRSMFSVNHGCGRRMSRAEARQRLSQSGVNKQMKRLNVIVNGGSGDVPIDESPDVYKSSTDVIAAVVDAGLATVTTTLTPIASIKGTD